MILTGKVPVPLSFDPEFWQYQVPVSAWVRHSIPNAHPYHPQHLLLSLFFMTIWIPIRRKSALGKKIHGPTWKPHFFFPFQHKTMKERVYSHHLCGVAMKTWRETKSHRLPWDAMDTTGSHHIHRVAMETSQFHCLPRDTMKTTQSHRIPWVVVVERRKI